MGLERLGRVNAIHNIRQETCKIECDSTERWSCHVWVQDRVLGPDCAAVIETTFDTLYLLEWLGELCGAWDAWMPWGCLNRLEEICPNGSAKIPFRANGCRKKVVRHSRPICRSVSACYIILYASNLYHRRPWQTCPSQVHARYVRFGARILVCPFRRAFLLDPYNWPDLLSATGLFFRAAWHDRCCTCKGCSFFLFLDKEEAGRIRAF